MSVSQGLLEIVELQRELIDYVSMILSYPLHAS